MPKLNPVQITCAASDHRLWKAKATKVLKIYNTAQKNNEQVGDLSQPELVYIAHINGVDGGVMFERMIGQESGALVTYAAFEKKQRRKGHLRRMMAAIEQYATSNSFFIVGIQMNPGDDPAPWHRLGFGKNKTFTPAGVLVLLNDHLPDFSK